MCPARVEFPNHPERQEVVIENGCLLIEGTGDSIFFVKGTKSGFSWEHTDSKDKQLSKGSVTAPDTITTPGGAVVTAL